MFGRFLTALALVLALPLAAEARAADSIYWTSAVGNTISRADLDGSGNGSDFDTGGGDVNVPVGVVLDPASNHLYWTNHNGNTIWRANLDGSGDPVQIDTTGATVSGPFGLAIDHASNSIFWTNYTGNTVSRANLDGTGDGSDLDTSGVTVNQPSALVIHPPSNRIGWVNTGSNTIARTGMDGSGGAVYLDTGAADILGPFGLAIDVDTGRMYWSNASLGSISQVQLDGTGGGNLDTGEPMLAPSAIAIDPESNSLYWGSYSSNGISRTNLDGTGDASVLDTSGATMNLPLGIALLKAPGAIEPPEISGGGGIGEELTCSTGTWASDSSLRSLYRAPAAYEYQWTLDGADIPGADEATYTPTGPGSYRCRVTASNHAGATQQTSEPISETGMAAFSVAPASRAFGSREADAGPSPAQIFTITNASAATVEIGSITVQGADADQFAIVRNACVAPVDGLGGTCAVDVVFNPTSAGAKSAAVRFNHSGPSSPLTVSVTGTATAVQASPVGSASSLGSAGPGASSTSAAPAATPAVASIFSTVLLADARGRLPVVLSCTGVGTCKGKIKIRTAKRVRVGRGKRKRKRVLTLASKRYANIRTATTRTVKMRLKKKGRRILNKLGKIRVAITLSPASAAAAGLDRQKGVVHARDAPLPSIGRRSGRRR